MKRALVVGAVALVSMLGAVAPAAAGGNTKSYVVLLKEGRDPDQPFVVGMNRRCPPDRLANAMRHPRGPERVLETSMHRGRKDEIRSAQLFDSAQPLKLRRVHQFDLERVHFDVAVNGVANQLSAHAG